MMEKCFTEHDTYASCPSAGHPLATGVEATLLDGGALYRVDKTSESGTTFTIRRLPRSYARACSQPEVGGCNTIGSW